MQGQGQGHGTFELPRISEAMHAGGDDRQPPCGAVWFEDNATFSHSLGRTATLLYCCNVFANRYNSAVYSAPCGVIRGCTDA